LLEPNKVGIQGITEAFKEARIKGEVTKDVYKQYTLLYTAYTKRAGDAERKATIRNEFKDLYATHIYKK
jgi:hypothetical protein